MRSRFDVGAGVGAAQHLDDMPAGPEIERQFQLLCSRLSSARALPQFSHWQGASGTVIMADVFTMSRFYEGVPDHTCISSLTACATKTMCEAVVEGMGGVWDRSASDRRHPSFQAGVQEAVIAWSAPQPWHREAEAFICRALSELYPVTLARPCFGSLLTETSA